MPTAMRALEKSTGKTAKELFKMMEMGQLGADYILPFTRALRELSSEGGALEKALKTLRVQEDRVINLSKLSGDVIYKSGFSEGLSELYKTMSDILEDAGPQLEKIGKIFGTAFKAIAYTLKLIEPPLSLIINNIEYLAGGLMIKKLMLLRATLATTFLPITVALAAAEELISLFSDKLVGVTEKAMGYQVNLSNGTKTNLVTKDGKLMSDPNTTRGLLADPSSGNTALANMTEEQFDKLSFFSKADLVLEQIGAMQADMMSQGMQNMFWDSPKQPIINQTNTIKVEGVSGEDVAYKVKRHLAEFTGNGGGR